MIKLNPFRHRPPAPEVAPPEPRPGPAAPRPASADPQPRFWSLLLPPGFTRDGY